MSYNKKLRTFSAIALLSIFVSPTFVQSQEECSGGKTWSSEATMDSQGNPVPGCVPPCPSNQTWRPNATYNAAGEAVGGCASPPDGW